MEDSFRVRVDKAFGSLAASSSSLPSLWALTDEEIERREWNRDRDSPDDDLEHRPYPSNLDGFFANQQMEMVSVQNKPSDFRKDLEYALQELNDDDDDENNDKQRGGSSSRQPLIKPEDHDDEEWDIRSSIGLDCTLDHEEEEDAYDKVAIGTDKAGDRLCMGGNLADFKVDINCCNELPCMLRDITRDSRANHMAAKIRIKEDAEAAGNFDSLRLAYNDVPIAVDNQNNNLEDGVNLKSILKRRENQMESKSEKRVRFDPGCKDDCEEESEGPKNLATEISSMEAALASAPASFLPQDSSNVPDYIRNPSKYTHYTFDSSSDIDEESNRKSYVDFLKLLKGPSTMESQDDISIELPKSVTFTPKKKPGDASVKNGNQFRQHQEDVCKECTNKKGSLVSMAAGDIQEGEICAMDEDEPEIASDKSSSLPRPGRKYRTKASTDMDELLT